MKRAEIDRRYRELEQTLRGRLDGESPLTIVKAPPGSGKTHLLVETIAYALGQKRKRLRIAVATQTNAQSDEVCERIHKAYPGLQMVRFVSSSFDTTGLAYQATSQQDQLPDGPCVVVGTSAKWGAIELREPFDILFIEEAWQLKLSDFMPLAQVAGRFVLVGDPGQIPPVVTLETARWATAAVPPHMAAPEVFLLRKMIDPREVLELPATRRLPHDTAHLVRGFYDFDFGAHAEPGERKFVFGKGLPKRLSVCGDALESGLMVGLTLATDHNGPPIESDREIAALAAETIESVLGSKTETVIAGKREKLSPLDIGIAATHRSMVQELSLALPAALRDQIKVDTPERWQGLERKLLLVVHPLSSVTRPSEFDLGTGRLCVMASRHKVGLIVLSRDHVLETLEAFDPPATQPLGLRDETGRGHAANREFIKALASGERWLKVA